MVHGTFRWSADWFLRKRSQLSGFTWRHDNILCRGCHTRWWRARYTDLQLYWRCAIIYRPIRSHDIERGLAGGERRGWLSCDECRWQWWANDLIDCCDARPSAQYLCGWPRRQRRGWCRRRRRIQWRCRRRILCHQLQRRRRWRRFRHQAKPLWGRKPTSGRRRRWWWSL